MKKQNPLVTYVTIRSVAIAALLAMLSFTSVQVLADKTSAVEHVEARITKLHTQINITPAQEEQWNKVAEVMRDNAKRLDALTDMRKKAAKTMTAVDDLKSYSEVATAHVEGIQKLIPLFETLYNSLSDAQKKEADEAFRHGYKQHHSRKNHH